VNYEQPREPEESAGLYSTDDDDQLSQEDTLIDRGVDDSGRGYRRRRREGTRDERDLDELLPRRNPTGDAARR